MKKIISNGVYLLMFFVFAFAACKKNDNYPPPPDTPAKPNQLQFIVQDFPGYSNGNANELYAVVSVSNSSNEEVISNKKVSFSFTDKYVSEKLQLPNDSYKVTKFLIIDAEGKVRFAAPVSPSVKASQVQKPLNIGITLANASSLNLPIEILKVELNDQPESFGYPAGTFGNQQAPTDTLIVKLQAVVTVGDINYDQIPASFKIISWDANGVMYQKDTLLAAGVNQIKLPKSHVKYQFKMNKWGISDEMTLERKQLNEYEIYTLGGSKAAKKLRLQETYLFAEGSYRPSSKAVYSYRSNGSLNQVDFYQKMPQHSALQFTHKNVYVYAGSNVSRINTVEANGTASGFIAFTYNPQGTKVVSMHRKNYDQETFASVSHSFPTGHALITIDYLFNN
ncbi:MAG TPA: hypothetical protein VD905_09410, partial [Flavobacteriales bacterium]|nr:hypothetical protein [Flavobacteriales bacterium]